MSAEDIRKAFIEELLKKIVSIDNMANIIFLSNYVDSILREENAINYNDKSAIVGDLGFNIRKYVDDTRDSYLFKEKHSFSNHEHKYNKKKKRFGK